MSAIWWYIPTETTKTAVVRDELSRAVLARVGLDRTLEDVRRVPDHVIAVDLDRGPDDSRGLLLYPLPTHGDKPAKLGYHADRQTWRQANQGRCWLGWETDSPPTPADLERRLLVPGYQIEDAAGQAWHVPVLRAVDNPRGRLGVSFSWDDDDQPRIGVDPRFAELWERSARAWDLIDKATTLDGATFAQDFGEEDDAFLLTYLLDCLAINYRTNNSVWSGVDRTHPGWLSQSVASLMLNATVDLFKYRSFLNAQKKTPC